MSQSRRNLRPRCVSPQRQPLSCMGTSPSESSGELGPVTKAFLRGRGNVPSVVCFMPPAAKDERVVNHPTGLTGARGHLTLENPQVGGSIQFVLYQPGWTC
jgi:hypothetical protein